MIYKGDVVTIDISVLKKHNDNANYINEVQRILNHGYPSSTAIVVNVKDKNIEIGNSPNPKVTVWIPTESIKQPITRIAKFIYRKETNNA